MSKTISIGVFLLSFLLQNTFAKTKSLLLLVNTHPLFQKPKTLGCYGHVITDVFTLEGMKVESKFNNWAREFHLGKVGKADGIAPVLKNE